MSLVDWQARHMVLGRLSHLVLSDGRLLGLNTTVTRPLQDGSQREVTPLEG